MRTSTTRKSKVQYNDISHRWKPPKNFLISVLMVVIIVAATQMNIRISIVSNDQETLVNALSVALGDAEKVMGVIDNMIKKRLLGSRSTLADARLNYEDPGINRLKDIMEMHAKMSGVSVVKIESDPSFPENPSSVSTETENK